MQAVVILQQILPKIANIFRENLINRSKALVQPWLSYCVKTILFLTVEVLRQLSVLLDLLLNPDAPNSEGQKLSGCGHLELLLPDRFC